MPKKVTWEDFQKGKEYLMWGRLYEMAQSLDLTGPNFISSKESGSGVYWEPFLVLLFKFGNILKQTGKLKEIKMDWIRPLNYLESQSNEHVTYDGDPYIVEKAAIGNATNARLALQHLLDSINNYETLNEQNFQKEYKTLHSDSSYFFKQLNIFVKDGFRALHENIKLILKPLRMLRKSAYRLVSLEKEEAQNEDLTMFESKKSMKDFVGGIGNFLQNEEYKMKRDCDLNLLDQKLGMSLTRDYYEYKFNDKIRNKEEEEKEAKEKAEGTNKEKKPKPKEEKKITIERGNKKGLSPEEEAKIKEMKERKELTFINIKELKQSPPSRFIREALQKDFEAGIDATLQHLNRKMGKDFPFEIEAHKIFVNINLIPEWRTTPHLKFYLQQLVEAIEKMKIKLYEMKLNGLSRIMIPISLNTEIVGMIKKVYDMHNVIDRVIGDKLLYEQYMFIYDQINMITKSSLSEELEVYKKKEFIEYCVPKYIFYQSMCHSAKVLHKMIENSRKDGGHFEITDYYQPTKHVLDSEDNLVINAYELKDTLKKALTEEMKVKIDTLWKEINQYGRFWLMEGYFPPEDKDKWLEAITLLDSINILVQEDIRDMILLNAESKMKEESKNESKQIEESKLNDTTEKDSKHPHKRNSKILKSQRAVKRSPSIRNVNKKKSSRKESLEVTEEDLVKPLPKKLDNLRPPIVWNYPIERVIQMKNESLIKEKKEIPKVDIRKVNPNICYQDKRVERFVDQFDVLFKNAINYAKSKGNSWEYTYLKILNVFQIEYQYTPDELNPKKEEKKEGEGADTKTADKTEESKI